MAGRSRPSFQKRQKEKARQERQKEKMERRLQRSQDKSSGVNHEQDIDYEFSIYAGLEPLPEETTEEKPQPEPVR